MESKEKGTFIEGASRGPAKHCIREIPRNSQNLELEKFPGIHKTCNRRNSQKITRMTLVKTISNSGVSA